MQKEDSMSKKNDDTIYVESEGFCYDDFKLGMQIVHKPGRTISEADNTWFSLLTMNQHPLHINEDYAKDTQFKKILVNSALTFSIINGMTVKTMSSKAIANLGWKEVTLHAPVFVGDTLYAKSKVINKRLSKSNPNRGIVTIETIGFNQDNVKVLSCVRIFMLPIL